MPLTRFEIMSRAPYAEGRRFGTVGAYEQVDGTAHFAVDPNHQANAPAIRDIGRAATEIRRVAQARPHAFA